MHCPSRVLERFSSGSRKTSSALLNRREPAPGFLGINRWGVRRIRPEKQVEKYLPGQIAFVGQAIRSVKTRLMLMTYEVVCNTRPANIKDCLCTQVHCKTSHASAQDESGLAFYRK